jgi:hypothetical protein
MLNFPQPFITFRAKSDTYKVRAGLQAHAAAGLPYVRDLLIPARLRGMSWFTCG